ncbi:MAG: hypothetical protein JWM90_544 [Thermoleophilia bacterium]|nr:hypothetical protein [Thermoleophilia bacterium]
MHQHFADTFNAIELGARIELRMFDPVIGNQPANIRAIEHAAEVKKAAEDKAKADAAAAAAKPAEEKLTPNQADKKAEPTAITQAKTAAQEIIKDGAIKPNEQTVLKGDTKVQDAVKSEKERLETKVAETDASKAAPAGSRGTTTTSGDHAKLVEELGTEKRPSIEEIDKQLKTNGISPDTKTALEALRRDRITDENKVANVIKDREALVGTLEAEKVLLKDGGTTEAGAVINDKKTKDAFEAFKANDGQVHTGMNWFGDDWGGVATAQKQDTLEEMAEHFRAHPELLDDWVSRQGSDDDAINNAGGADKHVQNLIKDGKVGEATKVDIRTDAAEDLKKAFVEYNKKYESGVDAEARIADIDTEIGKLDGLNERDKAVLSKEIKDDLNAHFVADADKLPADTSVKSDTTTETHPTNPGYTGSADNMERQAEAEAKAKTDASGETPKPDAVATTKKVDYSTPAAQAEVVAKATEAGILPAGSAVGSDGNAYYTVQEGDSYWAITEKASAGGFDANLFSNTLAVNTERLGRQSNPAMIYAGEQLVLPGRSVTDLIALLNLPTEVALSPEEIKKAEADAARLASYENNY